MKKKGPFVQVPSYKKAHGIMQRIAFRKNATIAAVVRQLLKEA